MSDENESGNDDSDTRSTDTEEQSPLDERVEQNAESIDYLTDLLEKTADSVDDLAGVVGDLDTDDERDDADLLEEPENLPEYR